MGVVKLVLYGFAGVGFWTVSASIALWLRDRSGNSGRASHWKDNPRIISPEDAEIGDRFAAYGAMYAARKVSDEDHEAYGAMIHAMKPRDDRRDEP